MGKGHEIRYFEPAEVRFPYDDLEDVGYGLDRSGSGYGQVEATCECGNEPSGSIKCGNLTSLEPVSFSRTTLLHGVKK